MSGERLLIVAVGAFASAEVIELESRLRSYSWKEMPEFARIRVDGDPDDRFPGRSFNFTRDPSFSYWEWAYASAKQRIRARVGKNALIGYNLAALERGIEWEAFRRSNPVTELTSETFDSTLDKLERLGASGEIRLEDLVEFKRKPELIAWLREDPARLQFGPKDPEAEVFVGYGVRPSEWLDLADQMGSNESLDTKNDALTKAKREYDALVAGRTNVVFLGAMWDWNVTDLIHRYLRRGLAPQQVIAVRRHFPPTESGEYMEARRAQAKADEKASKYLDLENTFRPEIRPDDKHAIADYLEACLWLGLRKLPKRMILRRSIVEVGRKWHSRPRAVVLADLPNSSLETTPLVGGKQGKDTPIWKTAIDGQLLDFFTNGKAAPPSDLGYHLLLSAPLAAKLSRLGLSVKSPVTNGLVPLNSWPHVPCPYENLIALIGVPVEPPGTAETPNLAP